MQLLLQASGQIMGARQYAGETLMRRDAATLSGTRNLANACQQTGETPARIRCNYADKRAEQFWVHANKLAKHSCKRDAATLSGTRNLASARQQTGEPLTRVRRNYAYKQADKLWVHANMLAKHSCERDAATLDATQNLASARQQIGETLTRIRYNYVYKHAAKQYGCTRTSWRNTSAD